MREAYFSTAASVQVHRPEGWPRQPHRQGFMAHTSMNRLGRQTLPAARVMVTSPSSRGWRRTSRASRENSGSSSRNSTPLWAREISPGRGKDPPPARATADTVWWGLRKGRRVSRGRRRSVMPATLHTSVASRASRRVMSGRMEGRRRAIMDLPAPGEPMSRTLCPPAAATSRARFTFSWPMTSAKSGPGWVSSSGSQAGAGAMGPSPRRWARSWERSVTGYTVRSPARVASAAFSAGTYSARTPARTAAMAMGRVPVTGRRAPVRDSSPRKAAVSGGGGTSPWAARMPRRMGRS